MMKSTSFRLMIRYINHHPQGMKICRYFLAIASISALLMLYRQFHTRAVVTAIPKVRVNIDARYSIHVIDRFSPSVTAEIGIFSEGWIKYFRNPKLITLVKALGPSYLRIGGTRSDHSHFTNDKTGKESLNLADGLDCRGNIPNEQEFEEHLKNARKLTLQHYEIRRSKNFNSFNISYSASQFDEFMNFVYCTNLKVIFVLNLLDRTNHNWDPAKSMALLHYAKSKGYHIDWELGNEPNSYPGKAQVSLTPTKVGEAFLTLKDILTNDNWWKESALYGPDVSGMSKPKNRKFFKRFIRYAGEAINSATFHHYYINSVNATVQNFTDYRILNTLYHEVDEVVKLVRKEADKLPIWMGETSSSYGGGANGLSNTYIAGFMWLDKLGISASRGVDVVFRQTLFGGNYALIDNNFDPNPDYWLTLLYKILVGQTVMVTTVSSERHLKFHNNGKFRAYAHCTNRERTSYEAGSVTVYYLNLLSERRIMTIDPTHFRPPKTAMVYIMTSGDELISKEVKLNGKRLQMKDDHTMPPLHPEKVELPNANIVLPEKSFGFIVLPDVKASIC